MSERGILPTVCGLVALLLLTAGCNVGVAERSGGRQGVCARQITPADLGMDIAAVAEMPFAINPDLSVAMTKMGSQRAQRQAEALLQVTTFCTQPLPEAVSAVLTQALDALRAGDSAQGVDIIRSLLQSGAGLQRAPGWMLIPSQRHADWRARIGATIQFAEELALQGNQAAYDDLMQDVGAYFSEQASAALEGADFKETLRIAEEALLLGQDGVYEKAREQLQERARQELEQAMQSFDPCLSSPDALNQQIRDMLNALTKAQFFGAASGLEEQAIAMAEKAMANYEHLGHGEPTDCAYQGTLTLSGSTGFVELDGELRSCNGLDGPWQGRLRLHYDDNGGFGVCDGAAAWNFSLPSDNQPAEGEISIPLTCPSPPEGCTYTETSEVLHYRVTRQGETLQVTIGSSGAGHLTMACQEDDGSTFTIGGQFAVFWGSAGGLTTNVPLTAVDACNQP